jgi:hypothetical protein
VYRDDDVAAGVRLPAVMAQVSDARARVAAVRRQIHATWWRWLPLAIAVALIGAAFVVPKPTVELDMRDVYLPYPTDQRVWWVLVPDGASLPTNAGVEERRAWLRTRCLAGNATACSMLP